MKRDMKNTYDKRDLSEILHDKLNESYANRLKGMDNILLHEEYRRAKDNKRIGEIDCFAYRERSNTAYIIETKLNNSGQNRRRARKQMNRAYTQFIPQYGSRYGVDIDRVVKLYVSSNGISCQGIHDKYKR